MTEEVHLTVKQAEICRYVLMWALGDDLPNIRQNEVDLRLTLAALGRRRRPHV